MKIQQGILQQKLSRRRLVKIGIPIVLLILLAATAWWLRIIQVLTFLAATLIRMWLFPPAKTIPTNAQAWTALKPPHTLSPAPASRSVVTYHPWYQNFHAVSVNTCLSEIAQLGATYVRSDIRWSDVIPDGTTPNEAAFAWYRAYFLAARDWYGLQPLIVLSNPASDLKTRLGNNAALLKAWSFYVEQVATRFGDLCNIYQLMNEPNNPAYNFFSPQDTGPAITSAAAIIRQHVPQAKIIVNILLELWGWKSFTEDLLKTAGAFIDIIGLDHYPDTWAFSWQSNWDAVSDLLAEIRSSMPGSVWYRRSLAVLETGYSTNFPYFRDEQSQVDYFQQFRQALQTLDAPLSNPVLALIGFYELCDADTNIFLDPEAHFGLLRSGSLARKPAFKEVRKICAALRNAEAVLSSP